MLPERSVGVFGDPVHLYIHQREICDVKRVGDLPHPFADSRAFGVRGYGTGSGKDQQREDNQDADRLIQSVPQALAASDARNGKDYDNRQSAPPETAFEMNRGAARIAFTPA